MNKTKTNVMRVLDKASIPYRTMEYEVDESDLSGVHVAEQLGQPCEQIFKTLVLKDEKGGHYVCCIPMQGKESGNVAVKGAAADHGLHPGRLFPHRHEEKVPHLHRRDSSAV